MAAGHVTLRRGRVVAAGAAHLVWSSRQGGTCRASLLRSVRIGFPHIETCSAVGAHNNGLGRWQDCQLPVLELCDAGKNYT